MSAASALSFVLCFAVTSLEVVNDVRNNSEAAAFQVPSNALPTL